jgi:hypothetical protein
MQLQYPSSARYAAAMALAWSLLALDFYSTRTLADSAAIGVRFRNQGDGVEVLSLDTGSALARAGVRTGDRLLSIAGRPAEAAAFVLDPEDSLSWADRNKLFAWQDFLTASTRGPSIKVAQVPVTVSYHAEGAPGPSLLGTGEDQDPQPAVFFFKNFAKNYYPFVHTMGEKETGRNRKNPTPSEIVFSSGRYPSLPFLYLLFHGNLCR